MGQWALKGCMQFRRKWRGKCGNVNDIYISSMPGPSTETAFHLSLMAASLAPVSVSASGGSGLKPLEFRNAKSNSFVGTSKLAVQRKSKSVGTNRNLSVCAEYRDGRSGAGDFVAGFLLGGAVFGTLAYIFAPQIRRSLLNEDEYGFRRAKRPIYYDEGLEKTRETLNAKISQLNSAIDNVSTRLRGGNSSSPAPVETDPEVGATM